MRDENLVGPIPHPATVVGGRHICLTLSDCSAYLRSQLAKISTRPYRHRVQNGWVQFVTSQWAH